MPVIVTVPRLPIERVLAAHPDYPSEAIGRSREGRPLEAAAFGSGPLTVSLIAGCHADEPVGPAMLDRLAGWLATRPPDDHLLTGATWLLVPHANPDGDARNAAWSRHVTDTLDHLGEPDAAYRLADYARHVVREAPGDDMEFGFPRSAADTDARPENRAIADFLRRRAPLDLHGSLHGMAFAPGPWFLIEREWIDRTAALRDNLRRRVAAMGYELLDWDRRGDKGFERIDEGFSTRPDSGAMIEHFRRLDDEATAALFRPSSMELARSLGGDPFTFVSEMPLFLHPRPRVLAEDREAFRRWLTDLAAETDPTRADELAAGEGIRPMPIRDQMRLQLAFVQEAIDAVAAAAEISPRDPA